MITQTERKYLLDSMKLLLEEYNYKYTTVALNGIIDEWAEKKRGLIEAFKKHPGYVDGKFMIAFQSDYSRDIDKDAIRNFSVWLRRNAMTRIDLAPQEVLDKRCSERYLPAYLWNFLEELQYYTDRCIPSNIVESLNTVIPKARIHAGEKMTRAVNKICTYMNYDTIDGYNKEFAKYADAMTPMVVKRHTVLSINPLDYLTMSFGNSWASCHTIDKENRRNMPNSYQGQYSSGTISYMLDNCSMVMYTVDSSYKGTEYWTQPKINRQMFHYAEDKLVQGRLYPQSNDCNDEAYTPYRNIVQNIMSVIFDFPNLWALRKGADNVCTYINRHHGTNYPDYEHFDKCNISIAKGTTNGNKLTIGELPMCVRCGDRHSLSFQIDCCTVPRCACCGARILDIDDVIEIDGETYCPGCAHYCDECGEYHVGDVTYVPSRGINVCDSCLVQYYVQCEECGRWVRKDNVINDKEKNKKICPRCDKRRRTSYSHTYTIDWDWF